MGLDGGNRARDMSVVLVVGVDARLPFVGGSIREIYALRRVFWRQSELDEASLQREREIRARARMAVEEEQVAPLHITLLARTLLITWPPLQPHPQTST